MKKTASQDGSAHVAIAVVIIVALLAGIGYVGYRAISKKTAATTSTTTTTQPTPMRDMTFADWNVKVSVARDSGLYVMKDNDKYGTGQVSDTYYVYDKNFDQLCVSQSGDNSTAAVTRVKASDMVDTFISEQPMTNKEYYSANPGAGQVIGDYVYVYAKPNGGYACTDPSTSGSQKAADAEGVARNSFYQAFLKLQAE